MPDVLVQRGTADVGNTGGTAAPGTSFGSTTSAFVRNLCNRRTSAGASAGTGNQEGDDMAGGLRITGVDEITFGRQAGSAAVNNRFAWESWEYTGSPSGDNEFIVRGRFQLTMGASTRTATAAVSGVVDENDCIAFVTGIFTDRTVDEADTLTALAWVDASGDLQVEHGGRLAAEVVVWVTVVEFTGSNWTVHHGRGENPGALSGDIDLRTASDGLGGSLSSVSDWGDAVIFHQFRSNLSDAVDEAIADTSAIYGEGSTTGTVTWTHHSNFGDSATSPNRSTHMVQVLEHADMVVTRPAFDAQSAAGAMNVAVTGISDVDHSSVEVSRYSSGGGTAYGRGWVTAQLTSLTNVELWAHRSGNTIATLLQVVDLSAIETTGGGVSGTGAASGTSSASSTIGGTVSGVGAASGASSASGTVSGAISGTAAAQGTSAAVATLSGGVSAAGSALGTSGAASTIGGTALGAGVSAGTSDASTTIGGTASGTGAAVGTSSASTTIAGGVSGTASAAGAATAAATLGGGSSSVGTASGTSSASATIGGLVSAAATAVAAAAAVAVVLGGGSLVATGEGSSTGSATLSDLGSAPTGSATGSSSALANIGGTTGGTATSVGSSTADATLGAGVAGVASTSGSSTASAVRFGTAAAVAYIGNSYTQNYGGVPALLEHYLGERLAGSAVSLGAPPHLGTTIANSGTDGWYPGMTLGGMALYPTIDQSSGGSTDALDAIDTVADDAYTAVTLTSGLRQESDVGDPGVTISDPTAVEREVLPGAGGTNPNVYGVYLEVTRRVVAELQAEGSTAKVVLRMTHEGFNANYDADEDRLTRTARLQVLGARQLVAEGVVDLVLPEHYVWHRLLRGSATPVPSGITTPVPAYSALTHPQSLQPGNANLAWLNRSQGDSGFALNGHQNAIATIVAVWAWGYMCWGIDPRGDTTFQGDPSGLPGPFDEMINPSGTRIYGGHNTGAGTVPYDTGTNPSGPPDGDLDLDWSSTTQGQIQDRIVAAIDDYIARATEFDGSVASADGTATATATMGATSEAVCDAAGASGVSAAIGGLFELGCDAAGTSSAASTIAGGTASTATAAGSSTASAVAGAAINASATSAGSSTSSSTIGGAGEIAAASSGTSFAIALSVTLPVWEGAALTSLTARGSATDSTTRGHAAAGTVRGHATDGTVREARTQSRGAMGQPWTVNPEDEVPLFERIVYPERTEQGAVVAAEAPVDLTGVVSLAVEVWDTANQLWLEIGQNPTGTGVTTEDENGETWYVATFVPAAGALQALTDVVGRGAHSRRWHFVFADGSDRYVPSAGYDTIALNVLPG